jgi:hypothetical protein
VQVESDGLSYNGGVATKLLLPKIVAQDRYRLPAGFKIMRHKKTTERRNSCLHHSEITVAHL